MIWADGHESEEEPRHDMTLAVLRFIFDNQPPDITLIKLTVAFENANEKTGSDSQPQVTALHPHSRGYFTTATPQDRGATETELSRQIPLSPEKLRISR